METASSLCRGVTAILQTTFHLGTAVNRPLQRRLTPRKRPASIFRFQITKPKQQTVRVPGTELQGRRTGAQESALTLRRQSGSGVRVRMRNWPVELFGVQKCGLPH